MRRKVAQEAGGFPWGVTLFLTVALGMVSVGAYATGGTMVRCEAVSTGRADCRIEIRRWLGRHAVEDLYVGRVVGVSTQAKAQKETYRPASGSERTKTRNTESWNLVLDLGRGQTESVPGLEQDVKAAAATVESLLKGTGPREVDLEFSDWKFGVAAMGFGSLLMLIGVWFAIDSRR